MDPKSEAPARAGLILASQSATRVGLLRNAGLVFEAVGADVDERAIETPLVEAGFPPDDVAQVLAEAKALDVSARHPYAYVLGADQTLGLGDRRFHKPKDLDGAMQQLLDLRGQTHQLHSALALVKEGEVVWRHVSTAHMTMRHFTPQYLGRYLSAVGDRVKTSVGGYQFEGPGIQLFERIDGDYFTILGLPVLPLLAELRRLGEIDT
jgi:septum formation protein